MYHGVLYPRGRSRSRTKSWEPRTLREHSSRSRPPWGRRAALAAEGVPVCARKQDGRVRAYSFFPLQSNSRALLTGPLPPPSAVLPSPEGDGFSLSAGTFIVAPVFPSRRRGYSIAFGDLLRPQPLLPATAGTPDQAGELNIPPSPLGLVMGCRPIRPAGCPMTPASSGIGWVFVLHTMGRASGDWSGTRSRQPPGD